MKQKRKYHEISDDTCETMPSNPKMENCSKRIKMSQSSILDHVDSDEEIWILKLPGHLNPDQLHDKQLSIRGKHNETIRFSNGETVYRYYEPKITKWKKDSSSNLTVLNQIEFGQFNMASIKCKGEINLIEAVEVSPIKSIEVPPKMFVEPPKDLHCRHPFFGPEIPNASPVINSTCSKLPSKLDVKKERKNKKSKTAKALLQSVVNEVRLNDGVLEKLKVEPVIDTVADKKRHKRKRVV